MEKIESVLLSWAKYHRRNEVLAEYLSLETKYFSFRLRWKFLRPLEYLLKLVITCFWVSIRRPWALIVQCPSLFVAYACFFSGKRYIIDAHNGVWQSRLHRFPLAKLVLNKAELILVHNHGVLKLAQEIVPSASFVVLSDPLVEEGMATKNENQCILVCSFSSDEPYELLPDVVRFLPDIHFIITGSERNIPVRVRERFDRLNNVKITGFLEKDEYNQIFTSSSCSVVLTSREYCQPCGACESISFHVPLVLSRNEFTEEKFNGVAEFVDHNVKDIVRGIKSAKSSEYDFNGFINKWMTEFDESAKIVIERLR